MVLFVEFGKLSVMNMYNFQTMLDIKDNLDSHANVSSVLSILVGQGRT